MSFGKTNYRTGGTRGGADRTWLQQTRRRDGLAFDVTVVMACVLATEFKWDDVKNDKYRENYLGHSVHAAVGRWQKGGLIHANVPHAA